MKNSIITYLSLLIFTFISIGLKAQITQNISPGDIKNYSVDTDDSPEGTSGSTYEWKIFTTDATPQEITNSPSLSLTKNTTSGNNITIDWKTTPAGKYRLTVVETNNTCVGTSKEIFVIINEININFAADNVETCEDTATGFTVSNAPANSKILYTITGGTTNDNNPILIDAAGNGKITVTPTAGSTLIEVILTEIELSNGTKITITPENKASTIVIVVSTSDIVFD
ncbi:hypothetical protein [Weeksella virosa]|uniref:Uncharacterized protein n=1 Tax=Weeksella virosa (strain ATCC 43766 / DSM 16922 / JCM 21250 / CCUG 30538 / CDC 9751 / IAM 14551 / NBRC 16016 / NCTC 11634 / CL345/78) TaxID=865938 RepID=F0P0A4_WEEVC|nr:hypothetical protein [Weeksella virosa]ADX68464.1 hypothetical protein Weevi_1773 [Weeksella virosa DSM 16922]VEH63879.1 Uncharacterised protein [Weeksella virosa]